MLFEAGLILSVAIGGWLALDYAMAEDWGRRSPAIGALGAFGVLWAGGELFLSVATTPGELAFGRRVLYLGVCGGVFCWFWAGVEANAPRWYQSHPRRLVLFALPSATIYSTLFWAPDGWLVSLRTPEPSHGPLFYVAAVVGWTLIGAGLASYAAAAVRLRRIRPIRTTALLGAILVPLALNILYVTGLLHHTDPTPALLGATALMIRFAVVDPGLARYLPLARKDVIEQLAVGVMVADVHGRVIDANASARALVGTDDLRGRTLDAICDGLPPTVEAMRFPLRSHLDETGEAVVLTDRRHAIETEKRLQLAGRLQAVGSLTAGMAHEINNPLAFIRSNLNLLEKLIVELGDPQCAARLPDHVRLMLVDGAECLIDARDGIDRISILVARLKDFARETRRDPTSRDPFDLAEAARRAAAVAGVGVPEGAIRVEVRGDPDVRGDEPVTVQILVNLVINAVQASAGSPEVTLEVLRDPDGAAVRVADRGPGIPPEVLERVFDPFFTTKEKGSGLGLSVSWELARRIGGRLEGANRPGGGAVFTLYLPDPPASRRAAA